MQKIGREASVGKVRCGEPASCLMISYYLAGKETFSLLLLAFETAFRSEWVEILSPLRENGFVIGVLFCLMRLF